MNQLLLIILAALQFTVFLILMLGKLFIRSIDPKGNLYSIDKWDKALIGAVILCIAVTTTLFVVERGNSYTAQEEDTPDTAGKIVSKIPKELLAKYGYELDTSSTGIAGELRDSFKTGTVILKEALPDFGLQSGNGIKVDSIGSGRCYMQLSFISKKAPVAGVTIRTVPAVLVDEALQVAPDPGNTYFYFPVGSSLAVDSAMNVATIIPYNNKGVIYCLLVGVVSNINRTQNYMTRKIFWVDPETKQSGEAVDAHYKLIDQLYRKQGFN